MKRKTVETAFTEWLAKVGSSYTRDPFAQFKAGWDARQVVLEVEQIAEMKKMFAHMQGECEDALDQVQTAGDDWNKMIRDKANEITNAYRESLYREEQD